VQKKLTITVDQKVYEGLHTVIGRRRISQFVESLVRPHVIGKELDAAYAEMAQDEKREKEALEWSEATHGDSSDETR
jgi:predicted CopG family antitoxin